MSKMQDQMDPLNFAVRGAVYIAERLFSSSLVAVVSRDDPRTLRVCHFNKGSEITSRKFDTKILSVKPPKFDWLSLITGPKESVADPT